MARQIALITGSSRGIGLAAAVELARRGFGIALNARRRNEELTKAKELIEGEGAAACIAPFDVGCIGSHRGALREIEDSLGPLTTLVNNAGVGVAHRGDVLDVSEESYDRCAAVNAKGMFFLTQAFANRVLSRVRHARRILRVQGICRNGV